MVIDNVMKEHAIQNTGMAEKQAQLIPPNFGEVSRTKAFLFMMNKKFSGIQCHFYLLRINCALRAVDEFKKMS